MIKKNILFIDLLYSKNGSFDDDFLAIRHSLNHVECHHLRCDIRFGFLNYIRILNAVLSFRYSKIVFLSSRISQLLLLSPLGFFVELYAIYHFLPRSRVILHTRLLPLLSKFFKIATYSSLVAELLNKTLSNRVLALPSRIIDKNESFKLLKNKLSNRSRLQVFIPGVRTGVRKFIDPLVLIDRLKIATGVDEINAFIQCDSIDDYDEYPNINFIKSGLPKDDYAMLYNTCHIVAIDFDQDYEVRASGVILDAVAAGCIVLTTSHEITRGYGFPNTILCDIESIESLIASIRNEKLSNTILPGVDCNDFSLSWRNFLKL